VLVREELDHLLHGGVDEGTNIISTLVETITRLVVQELLEAEQADFLGGRGRYQRRAGDQRGSRNGYEGGRIRTAEGAIGVRVPQTRGADEPFRSGLMTFLEGNSEVLDRLVTEMYARGLSTRDVEDAFRDATGELLISKSAVSSITDRLWEDYQAFVARDLADIEVHYLFCDAVTSPSAARGPRRPCWSLGASTARAESTCCTWPWATASPRRRGPSASGTCWPGACGCPPR
jgi:transposase-like protein